MDLLEFPYVQQILQIELTKTNFCSILLKRSRNLMNGYKKNENIILRKVEPYFFLIDITENYVNGFLFDTNEIGAFIWENIDSAKDVDCLTTILFNAISSSKIDIEELKRDVLSFISQLIKQNLLIQDQKL